MSRQSQKSDADSINVQVNAENAKDANITVSVASPLEPQGSPFAGEGPLRFTWYDIREIIVKFDLDVSGAKEEGRSIYDLKYLDLDEKNALNGMGDAYYENMKLRHEPYFGRIERFLADPANEAFTEAYGRVADELTFRLSIFREELNSMEKVILHIHDEFLKANPEFVEKRRLVLMILNFMYANCDFGDKV